MAAVTEEKRKEIVAEPRFMRAQKSNDLPLCFSRIEQAVGRADLEAAVAAGIKRHTHPGELLKELSNWPFAGYVTTNYDRLILRALQANGQGGGRGAGNSDSEIRKLSGDAANVIWYLHGAVDHVCGENKLIITDADYDQLSEGSAQLLNSGPY